MQAAPDTVQLPSQITRLMESAHVTLELGPTRKVPEPVAVQLAPHVPTQRPGLARQVSMQSSPQVALHAAFELLQLTLQ
jgi:hypothetical protein